MANKADGGFYVDSGIDTSGIEAGAEKIKETMKDAASSISDMGESAKQTTTNILEIKEAVEALEKAEQDLKALSKQGKTFGDFEYDEAFIGRADALKRIKEYQAGLTRTPEQAQAEQERVAAAAEAARIKQQALAEKEAAAAEKAAAAALEADTLRRIGESAEISNPKVAALVQRLQELKDRQATLEQAGVGLGSKEYDDNEREIAQVTSKLNAYRQSLTSTSKETKKLDGHTRKSRSAFSGFGEKLKSAGASMKKGIVTLLKYAIGLRTLMALFNKIRGAIKEGLGNLAQYDTETNASLSALKSSLTQLKNSLATAFTPILQVVVPILTTLIGYLIQAANAIGTFLSALTGKKKMIQAVEVQENYAEAVAGTGSAAKEAKKYLSGLDEIQTFSSDNGGGGGGGGGGVDPSSMFKEVEVETTSFMDELLDLIEKGNWHGVGEALAKKVNDAIGSVDWREVGNKIGEKIDTVLQVVGGFISEFDFSAAGTALAESVNGIFESIDWENLGQLINDGAIGALEFIDSAIADTDWDAIGRDIGTALNQIDFEQYLGTLGKTVGDEIVAALDLGSGFLQETDWQTIGHDIVTGIGDFFKNLDAAEISAAIGEFLASAISGIAELGIGLWEGLKELGQSIADGILNGAADPFTNLWDWIKENIFQPFIDAFEAAFEIGSPSKVMEDEGVYIMEGLLGGISGLVESVVQVFKDLKDDIVEKWDEIKDKASEKWDAIRTSVSGKWIEVRTKLVERWNSIKTKAKEKWDAIKATAGTSWNKIRSKATEKWIAVRTTLVERWNSIKAKAEEKWNAIKSKVIISPSAISDNWEAIKTKLSEKWEDIKAKVTEKFTAIKDKIVEIWNAVKTAIKAPINGLIGLLNSLLTKLVYGINSAITKINSIGVQLPAWMGGGWFGFNFPYISYPAGIPYLASGAVIPPNAPFTAVLGDQRRGNNIETPENLLRQIVREESGRATYQFVAQINRKTLFDQMIEEAKMRQIMTGRDPFALA